MRSREGRTIVGSTMTRFFLCILASAADAATVNPKGIITVLANGLITFFINGNPVLVMDQEVYQKTLLIVSFKMSEFLTT